MVDFKSIEDVEEWLEPMNYEQFWREIRPYCLVMFSREEADAQLEQEPHAVSEILGVLKAVAATRLIMRHDLKLRPIRPRLRLVASQD